MVLDGEGLPVLVIHHELREHLGTRRTSRSDGERAGALDAPSEARGELGDIEIKMSGCMNACGHHHVGHIGILGVDKHGEEWYQITLGGSVNGFTALGDVIGPSVRQNEVAETIARVLEVYCEQRKDEERFIETYRRIGLKPFKERVYAQGTAQA